MDKPVLLIDNYDSFTYMLADGIRSAGADCVVVRNDDPRLSKMIPGDYLALVISPGPGTPEQAGDLMKILPTFINHIPTLGICLGQQAIGVLYGANLVHAKQPRHGKVDWHTHEKDMLFKGVPPRFQATRYHSLVLTHLPEVLNPICLCNEEIMGVKHRDLPVWGLQFHPESCQTTEGLKMIKNFVVEAKKIARN